MWLMDHSIVDHGWLFHMPTMSLKYYGNQLTLHMIEIEACMHGSLSLYAPSVSKDVMQTHLKVNYFVV